MGGNLKGAGAKLGLSTILLTGALLREVFSFWTGHPFDFELWVRTGYYTTHGVSPYGILPSVPGLSFASVFSSTDTATVGYFPLWPLVTAAMYLLYTVVGFGNRFVYYFLLKQPLILGDLAVAYLLYLLVRRERPGRALWAAKVWAFLPLNVIFAGIWGMFDSLAIALVMASILSSAYSRRSVLSGLATLAKSIPIIYAIPLTMPSVRRWWGVLVSVLLPASFTLVVAFLLGWPVGQVGVTLGSTVVKGGGSMSAFELLDYLAYLGLVTPQLLQGLWTLGFIWVPAVIVGTILAARAFGLGSDQGLIQVMLVATLCFLIFKSQVNEQYSLYLIALGILDVTTVQPKRAKLLAATVLVVTVYVLGNNLLLLRFLSPIWPQAATLDSGLDLTLAPYRDPLKLLVGTAFTLLNVLYLASMRPSKSRLPPGAPQAGRGEPRATRSEALGHPIHRTAVFPSRPVLEPQSPKAFHCREAWSPRQRSSGRVPTPESSQAR